MLTRRELLACLAAGGCITAAGLWWPGQKLISIPNARRWREWRILDQNGKVLASLATSFWDKDSLDFEMQEAGHAKYLQYREKLTNVSLDFKVLHKDVISIAGLELAEGLK